MSYTRPQVAMLFIHKSTVNFRLSSQLKADVQQLNAIGFISRKIQVLSWCCYEGEKSLLKGWDLGLPTGKIGDAILNCHHQYT